MLFWSIHTKSIGGNFKLGSSVAKGHEGQYPDQNADSFALGIVSFREHGTHDNAKTHLHFAQGCCVDSLASSVFQVPPRENKTYL
jgi:hypothetical protein